MKETLLKTSNNGNKNKEKEKEKGDSSSSSSSGADDDKCDILIVGNDRSPFTSLLIAVATALDIGYIHHIYNTIYKNAYTHT